VRASGFSAPAAGKTGTTSSATDTWFVGYTPAVVAAVWLGHDQPRSIGTNATGGRLAAPVWARIMGRSKVTQGGSWKKPDGIVERWVDADSAGSGSGYREVFLRGRIPNETCPQRGDMYAAHRAASAAAAVDETLLEEWPAEIAGRSEPAPSPDYEEAERASRVTIPEAQEEAEKEEEQEAARKTEEAEKAEQEKKAAESVLIPQKTEPLKPPASGNQTPKIPGGER
jgi:membrane carboxypeptidase/penicillin-binding protein